MTYITLVGIGVLLYCVEEFESKILYSMFTQNFIKIVKNTTSNIALITRVTIFGISTFTPAKGSLNRIKKKLI